jgi:hypothetical protein
MPRSASKPNGHATTPSTTTPPSPFPTGKPKPVSKINRKPKPVSHATTPSTTTPPSWQTQVRFQNQQRTQAIYREQKGEQRAQRRKREGRERKKSCKMRRKEEKKKKKLK